MDKIENAVCELTAIIIEIFFSFKVDLLKSTLHCDKKNDFSEDGELGANLELYRNESLTPDSSRSTVHRSSSESSHLNLYNSQPTPDTTLIG